MAAEYPRQSSVEHAGGVVQVIQLTDSHLCAGAGGTLLGVDTDHSLQAVIELVRRDGRQPDIVLGTGDMADGGARGAYQRLGPYFRALCEHSYFLPGNHDDRGLMEQELGAFPAMAGEVRIGPWQIVMLDSQIPGEVGGHLGEDQLRHLSETLAAGAQAGLYALVCMHHHPLPVGCAWLDEQQVDDADALFAVMDSFEHVRGLLWGHVHQQVDWQRREVKLMGSPSTCVQFAPGYEDFMADTLPPGYRWLELHPDGRLDSGVVRAVDLDFTVDTESGGYLEH